MLKQRLLTALVLIPLVLAAILWLEIKWFSLLFSIVIAIGAWEWGALSRLKKYASFFYSGVIISILFCLFYINNERLNTAVGLRNCGRLFVPA